jgi:hypothetical protein
MINIEQGFSLDAYRDMIEWLHSGGYQITDYKDIEPDQRQIILRHDIDMSLDAAVAVAEVEQQLGVQSTYFVLLRTEFYNIFSRRGNDALQRLQALGHRIGLHFDASYYHADKTDFAKMAQRECDILETVLGDEVKSLSLHRPHRSMLDNNLNVPGRLNAYEPRFFRDIGYCSDSRGGWHYGPPNVNSAVKEGRAMQLLTHPIWWDAGRTDDVRSKLDKFALTRFDLIRSELAANCQSYPQSFKILTNED